MPICPRDKSTLEAKTLEGAEIWICLTCDGIYLPFESAKVLYDSRKVQLPSKYYHEEKFDINYSSWESEINCPNDNFFFMTYKFRKIEIDICPECNSLWLDKGEFEKLEIERDSFENKDIIGSIIQAIAGLIFMR